VAKFDSLGKLAGEGANTPLPGIAPGAGGFFKDLNESIKNFRDVLKLAQELRGDQAPTNTQVMDKLPDYPPPKPAKPASNPALGKFLAEYGDTTVDEALKILKPMTIKQIISMVQHGTRPVK